MCVIVCGAPWDGYRVFGPFADSDEATDYWASFLWMEDFWWIMPLAKEEVPHVGGAN